MSIIEHTHTHTHTHTHLLTSVLMLRSYLALSSLKFIVFLMAQFLSIKRFNIALKSFHFKITKSSDNINLVVVIAFNDVSSNRAERRLASQTKQTLGKVHF